MGRSFLNKLKRMDYLISRKATGSPTKLAERMELSETTLFEYMAIMKELGTPIRYDRFRQTYYYEDDGNFIIHFQKKDSLPDTPFLPECPNLI